MKRTALLSIFLLCLCSIGALAQKPSDSVFVSRNGTTFRVGQKVTLGLGTGTDGAFRYVVGIQFLTGMPSGDGLPADWATKQVTIAKIKHSKKTWGAKDETVYLVFRQEKQIGVSYGINVEPALLAKEIITN